MTAVADDYELEQRARARQSALVDMAEHDLGLFIELNTPEYQRPEHLAPLLDALDRSMTEPVYALVEVSCRHGKTDTLLHGCARRLRYRPQDEIAYCSYSSPLALRKSRKCRDIAVRSGVWVGEDQRSQPPGGKRFDPSAAVSHWGTVEGGSFTAGGRRSSFKGDGYAKIVYDDPFKDRQEAESPTIQDAAMDTWRGMLSDRIDPGGSAFITHQAWNDLDVIAQLKDGMGKGNDGQEWEVISLPAVIDAVYDEKTGRLIGGTPLWPARWSLKELARRKYNSGDYDWFSQWQTDRRPRGDTLFRDPARYTSPRVDGAVVMISVDPGVEDNKMRDSSGILVGSCYRLPSPYWAPGKPDFDVYVDVLLAEDQWRDWPELLDYLQVLQTQVFPGAPILLEEVSAFKALSKVARRLNKQLSIYPVTPKGDKWFRAQPAGNAWNKGRIRTPIAAPWVDGFHKEAKRFTGKPGGKDNRIDALTQLYDYSEHALAALAQAQGGSPTAMASSPF